MANYGQRSGSWISQGCEQVAVQWCTSNVWPHWQQQHGAKSLALTHVCTHIAPRAFNLHMAPLAFKPQEWRRSEQGHAPMINSPQIQQQGWGDGGSLTAKLFK